MSILNDMDDMWAEGRDASRKVASRGLLAAQRALSKCSTEAAEKHDMDLAEAIADWETVLTVAAEMLMRTDEPPTEIDAAERLALLARVRRADQELEAQVDQEMQEQERSM